MIGLIETVSSLEYLTTNMTFDIKNVHVIFFFKLKNLIHELIFVKNNFYTASIKNDNGNEKKICAM